MRRSALLGILVLLFAASGAGIGVSPAFLDLGTVERGETRTVTVYVTTDSLSDPFTVRPSARDMFGDALTGTLSAEPERVSEQSMESWVRFTRPSFPVDPGDEFTVEEDGSTINAAGEVTFQVSVPPDAEPGVHAGSIRLNPQLSNDGQGYGSRIVGESVFRFTLHVPGNARRGLEVSNIEAYRTSERTVSLFATVENTGTVTSYVRGGLLTIRDPTGDRIDRVSFGTHAIPPGGQKTIQKHWTGPDIEGGQYQLSGGLDYVTGEAAITGNVFSIPDTIEIVPPNATGGDGTSPSGGSPFPLPLALMVLALMAVLMYSFEVDPAWIIGIIGFLAVAAVILATGIPDYTIAILILIAAALFYIE